MITSVPGWAVTLWPEWAFAICKLGKDVENRTRALPKEQLGHPFFIHAGAHFGGSPTRSACESGLEGMFHHAGAAGWGLSHEIRQGKDGWNVRMRGRHENGRVLEPCAVPRRALVAIVTVRRCEAIEPSAFIRTAAPWDVGPIGWRLEEIAVLPRPVRCNGAQGLWRIEADLFVELQRQIAELAVESLHAAADGRHA